MDPLHIFVLEHAFSLPRPSGSIPKKIVGHLPKFRFDGEKLFLISNHLGLFNFQSQRLKVYIDNERCKLFTVTFNGRIKI